MLTGRLFQSRGAAAMKERSPMETYSYTIVDSLFLENVSDLN